MKVLVTGSSGFIGKAVTRVLKDAGHSVEAFDRAEGYDVTDLDSCNEAVSGKDAVIHLAGILGTDELFDNIDQAMNININGSVNIMKACIPHLTHYIGITMPPVFPSIYTATKVSAARFATAFHHNFDIPVTHVRAFNAFGSEQAHGEGHPRKIIPAFSVEGWQGIPLKIWGDGSQTVDLIHVDEIAMVFLESLNAPGNDETIDAGTGLAQTVKQVAQFVLNTTGSDAGMEFLPMRRGEIPTNIVAKQEGWEYLTRRPTYYPGQLRQTIIDYKDRV
jgi:UDP-glucose 4-epimerase